MAEVITFDGRGPLASALRARGFQPSVRTAQQSYAQQIEACLDERMPGFVDAETGVGKTLGYLIPMLQRAVADHRKAPGAPRPIVVVSTATVALQKQLIEDDLPIALDAVEHATGARLRAAIRFGKAQVIDPAALAAAVEEHASESKEEKALADEVIAWTLAKVAAGELPLRSELWEEFATQLKTAPIWLSPSVVGLQPADPGADAETAALYNGLLEQANDSDVLVINHHLLSLHLLRPFLWDTDRPVYLVVDEADRLPDVVEEIGRTQIPLVTVRSLLRTIGGTQRRQSLEIADGVIENAMTTLYQAWNSPAGGAMPFSRLHVSQREEIHTGIRKLIAEIDMAVSRTVAEQRRSAELRERTSELARYSSSLDTIRRMIEVGDYGRAVIYYTPIRKFPGFAVATNGAARIIAKKLWREPDSDMRGLIFTSATLSTLASGGDTDAKRALHPYYRDAGFDSTEVPEAACAVIAPARFGKMDFIRPPFDAPPSFENGRDDTSDEDARPLSSAAVAYWSKMIQAAAQAGGRVLVLVPSYSNINALADLEEVFGSRLILQRQGFQTAAAKALFLAGDDTVWISAAAWEGVSLPGAIRHIVIPRFPIPPSGLRDRLLAQYIEEATGSKSRGSNVVMGRRMASARRKLRQGIGRGIRAPDDEVTIWLGDYRWPYSQSEIDSQLADQPSAWSSTMLNAIPRRFRKKVDTSPRFAL